MYLILFIFFEKNSGRFSEREKETKRTRETKGDMLTDYVRDDTETDNLFLSPFHAPLCVFVCWVGEGGRERVCVCI